MLQRLKFRLFSPTIELFFQDIDCKLYHHCVSKGGSVDDNGDKSRKTRENGECDFQLYKSRGQHLLTNARVLDSIVKKSNITTSDTVLEIGPGTGNLTLRLLQAAHKVVAIEIDRRMAEALQKRVTECGLEDQLNLICKDALKTEFPQFDLVVANIPYGISSPLIAKLVFGRCPFRSATLLLQKEFARRLLANPGDSEFNRLAVNVKLVAEVEHIMDVSKRDFLPVPKVDSSVVLIRPREKIPIVDLNEWLAFTRTCFSKKNKTLGATFKQKKKLIELMRISNLMGSNEDNFGFNGEYDDDDDDDDHNEVHGNIGRFGSPCLEMGSNFFKEKVVEILKSSGFEDKRPSKLSIEELLHLLSLFNQNKIYFYDKQQDPNDEEL